MTTKITLTRDEILDLHADLAAILAAVKISEDPIDDKLHADIQKTWEKVHALIPVETLVDIYDPITKIGHFSHVLDEDGKNAAGTYVICTVSRIKGKVVAGLLDIAKPTNLTTVYGRQVVPSQHRVWNYDGSPLEDQPEPVTKVSEMSAPTTSKELAGVDSGTVLTAPGEVGEVVAVKRKKNTWHIAGIDEEMSDADVWVEIGEGKYPITRIR